MSGTQACINQHAGEMDMRTVNLHVERPTQTFYSPSGSLLKDDDTTALGTENGQCQRLPLDLVGHGQTKSR